ncbi:MAG: hypothetical protein ACI3WR_02080 [Oscillospiraceae bacterium]
MELQHPYPGVGKGEGVSYGGDQRRCGDGVMRRCGCGVVCAADLLLYLHRHHPGCRMAPFRSVPEEGPLTQQQYDALTRRLRRGYFPLVYPFGLNGLTLAAGLNLFFRRYGVPYTARWGAGRGRLWQAAGEMLAQDLPVILAVGPNLPRFWEKQSLRLYRGQTPPYVPAGRVRAHFLTVTAMDGEWLRISSWGAAYHLRRAEFEDYVRRYSSGLVSDLLYLRPAARGKTAGPGEGRKGGQTGEGTGA